MEKENPAAPRVIYCTSSSYETAPFSQIISNPNPKYQQKGDPLRLHPTSNLLPSHQSSAPDSEDSALCEEAKGYSPPMPMPVMIRATINVFSRQANVLSKAPSKVMMEQRINPERLEQPRGATTGQERDKI
jgi:hypothetical protein